MDQTRMYMMFEHQHTLNNNYRNSSSINLPSYNFGSIYSIKHLDNSMNLDNRINNQIKSNKVKICKVCGDISKSNHFGALCCCSCKAFFRRSVQNESYKNFHCPYNSNCEITILSRKCCQFCRFEKCVAIGMEKSWVMSEEERLQLLKNRLIKKQKKEQEDNHQKINDIVSYDTLINNSNNNSDNSNSNSIIIYYPDYNLIDNYLTTNEINQIEMLINDYLIDCVQIQPKFIEHHLKSESNEIRMAKNNEEIIQLFLNCVYQFTNFAKRLKFFKELKLEDQQILLRNCMLELCFLRGAYLYQHDTFYRTILIKNNHHELINSKNQQQNKENFKNNFDYQFSKVPVLSKENLENFIGDQLMNKFSCFIKQIQECNLDEIMCMLTLLIVLLNPENSHLINCKHIIREQEFYLDLLERYINWKFGSNLSGSLFAKLLMTFPNLKELVESEQLENKLLEQFTHIELNQLDQNDKLNSFKPLPSKIFKIKNLID